MEEAEWVGGGIKVRVSESFICKKFGYIKKAL